MFPGEFVAPERVVTEVAAAGGGASAGKRPLFILLDATWPEARKMFRKARTSTAFPVLSLQPEQISRYQLRRSRHDDHFCTAGVGPVPGPGRRGRRPRRCCRPGRVHPPLPAGQAPAAAGLAGQAHQRLAQALGRTTRA